MIEWRATTLGTISESIRNGIFARRPNDSGSGERILRISAVKGTRVDLSESRYVDGLSTDQISNFSIREGDLLITRYNGSRRFVGTAGLVPGHNGTFLHPDKLIRVTIDQQVADPRFIAFQLAAPATRAFLEPRIRTTAGQSGISGQDVREIPLMLPPVAEQRRIVEILEDHLSRLDAANDYLDAALRRAELARAAALVRLSSPDDPAVLLGSLALGSGYGTSMKCAVDGPGPVVVRIPNIQDGTIDLTDQKRATARDANLDGHMLRAGDLLVVRTNGSRDLIGRTAVVPEGVDAAFASYLIRFRLDSTRVTPRWAHLMLARPAARRVLEQLAASSAGQYNLGLKKLNAIEMPTPTVEEQDRRTNAYQETTFELAVISAAARRARARSDALRSAVFTAAFSGRLTKRTLDANPVQEVAVA